MFKRLYTIGVTLTMVGVLLVSGRVGKSLFLGQQRRRTVRPPQRGRSPEAAQVSEGLAVMRIENPLWVRIVCPAPGKKS